MATPVQNWASHPLPHHETIPILLELGVPSQHAHQVNPLPRTPMIQPVVSCDGETQTIPVWDHLMRMSMQTYFAHKLEPLLETRLRGSKCIHLKGLSLDDLLAMVVERHNALCVHPSVLEKKQKTPVVQTSVDGYSEADAAAKVMVDLLNAQHQHILERNSNLQDSVEIDFQTLSGEVPKKPEKTPRKRPAVSTKDQLLRKGWLVLCKLCSSCGGANIYSPPKLKAVPH